MENHGKVIITLEEYRLRKSANYFYTSKSVIMHLENFLNKRDILITNVDKKFVLKFIRHLEVTPTYRGVPLNQESIYTYYMHFCIGLNKAVKRELIDKNPCYLVSNDDKPKRGESKRQYLTLDEVKKMAEDGKVAVRSIRRDAIEKLKALKKDIEAEYKKIATGYNVDIETVKSGISEESISEDIILRKAVDFIKENAVINAK